MIFKKSLLFINLKKIEQNQEKIREGGGFGVCWACPIFGALLRYCVLVKVFFCKAGLSRIQSRQILMHDYEHPENLTL